VPDLPEGPRIRVRKQDLSISGVAQYYNDGELNIHPEYQRGFVWDKQKSSRLILTILSGRLVPPVTLHEKQNESYDVVDGKQR
jgi:uncharacterized protein with ParB-like and HNH nuclease domain